MTSPSPLTPVAPTRGPAGDEQRRRRFWWVFGTLGVLAMSAVAIWFGIAASAGVSWTNTGYVVVDEQQVQVRFDLVRDPSRAVSCVLEAQDERHAVVGATTVVVPAEASSPSRHIETVRTATLSVTGYVDTCEYATP